MQSCITVAVHGDHGQAERWEPDAATITLETGVAWIELQSTAEDWNAADPELLATCSAQLHLIRAFEETVLELAAEGLVHGPAHSSIGQEGGAVGSIVGLRSTGCGQRVAPGPPPVSREGADPRAGGPMDLARSGDTRGAGACSSGRSPRSSAWLRASPAAAADRCTCSGSRLAPSAPTPSSAAARRWRPAMPGRRSTPGTTDVSINYFGDGASQIGSVLESMNLAAAWKLPLCFFIENNLYAVSTHADEVTADARFSVRGQGFGIPAWRVDGMDPLAVHLATAGGARAAARRARARPSSRRRYTASSIRTAPIPGSAFGYRTRTRRQAWRERDPLARVAREMAELGLLSDAEVGAPCASRPAGDGAMRGPAGRAGPREPRANGASDPTLWPDPAFVDVGIRGDASRTGPRDGPQPAHAGRPGSDVTLRRCRGRRHGPADGEGPPHRRPGRGRAPSRTAARTERPRGSPRSTAPIG